jgi:hypothetical protein
MATRSIVSISVSDSDQLQINKINSNFQTVFSMAKEATESISKIGTEKSSSSLEGVQKQIKQNTSYVTKSEASATYAPYSEINSLRSEISSLWAAISSMESSGGDESEGGEESEETTETTE